MKRPSSHQEARPVPHARADKSDAEEFAGAMEGVTRIARSWRHTARPRPVPLPPPAPTPDRTPHPSRSLDPDEELADFAAGGVDRRELRRLKRGDHTPGAQLDLHGLTGAEASAATTRFLDASRLRFRCVAIVHGRGLHSAGHIAVLRTRVRTLLRAHAAVLAFADAPPSAGGSGAVYVLLRK